MIDSRLALLGTTANPGAALQQYQAGKLNNLLGQAKLDQIPIENAQTQQKIDVSKRNADIDEQKLMLDIRKQMASEDAASVKEGVRVAGLVSQVQSPEDWAALVAQNPKDLGPLSSVQYGTPEFEKVRRASEIMVKAANPDNTLVEIADPTSPTGTRMVPRADAINQPGKPPSGTNLTVGPDGTVQLTQGRNVGGMTKPLTNKTQEDVLAKTATLDRLEELGNTLDPKFLTFSSKLGNSWTAVKEKFQLGEISPAEEKDLQEFTAFKSDALNNLNLYIKDITGAAMSEAEAGRIRKAMPDPGEGLFDGDSPTEFMAKYNKSINTLKVARARQQYALKNGQNWENISLASMKDILKQEQNRFYQEAGWRDDLPDNQKEQIVQQVKTRLRDEYGF